MIHNIVCPAAAKSVPEFTYTGAYAIVKDDHTLLTDLKSKNWMIGFLTSGTLTFTKLNGAKNGIDVFLVGGGGGGQSGVTSGGNYFPAGGGGGGYTDLFGPITPGINTAISVLVGAGGAINSAAQAGTSSFGSFSVVGGYGTKSLKGGNGGSGGGGGGSGAGGTDGGNGEPGVYNGAGIGQGTTTWEFGETSGFLYSNGGNGGGGLFVPQAKAANTGHGGDGGGTATAGASGMVVIRNQRI